MNRESATVVDVSWVFPFPRTYRLIRIRNGWLVDKWLPANVLWKLSFEYLIYAIYTNGENTEYIFEMSTKYRKCTNICYLNIACLSCTLTIFFFFFWGQTLQSFARTSKDQREITRNIRKYSFLKYNETTAFWICRLQLKQCLKGNFYL